MDSLFLVNHVLLHFRSDHQILHSSDPGFLQSLEKGRPTGVGLPLVELEPDGLDGMIAIQRGSNPNLPPIPTVPTVDEEHGSTLLEELHYILQHAEGDEHLGSHVISSPFPNLTPVQPVHDGELPVRHRNVRPRVVLCHNGVADSLDALLPAERSACVETAHNSSFPLSAFRMSSKHLTASSSSPRGLKLRVVTFFGVL